MATKAKRQVSEGAFEIAQAKTVKSNTAKAEAMQELSIELKKDEIKIVQKTASGKMG